MTRRDKWAKRPVVQNYFAYCDALRIATKQAGYIVQNRVHIVFNVPMPPSWSKKKREEFNGKPHQQKPDVDNYLKAFLDALCTDDSYVFDAHAEKYWTNEKVGFIDIVL